MRHDGGYIALTSSLILLGVIAIISLVLATTSLLARYNTVLFDIKKDGRFAAESCLEVARLKLAAGSTYGGNETIAVGSSTCSILAIEVQGANKLIKASSTIQEIKTNLKLLINSSTLEKVSLEEVRNF